MAAHEPVPFFDWRALYAERATDFARILHETAAAGGFILQKAVDDFEAGLAAYLGVRHAIGLSDCTNAMLLGLVDPQAIEQAITARTRAIMPVHVNGRVCAMDAIAAIAERHGLAIYEDAAQALGAKLDGRAAGRFGRWGAFSFYPSKTLGCFGDAGALVTDDDDLAARVRAMRNHGAGADKIIPRDIAIWGTNARIDTLHAAILAYKLAYYDEAIARRRAIALRYHEAFSIIEALTLPPAPDADPRLFDIYQNYEMRCDRRDALRAHLAARGIGTIVQWGGVGIHQFRNLSFDQALPITDRFFDRALLLPMNHLLADDQVGAVIDAVRDFFT